MKGKNDKNQLEEGVELKIDFLKIKKINSEVILAIIQDWKTKDVLMGGYVNKEALAANLKERFLTFWSTSRNELWVKGSTSGCTFGVKEVRINCEQNMVLLIVEAHVSGRDICHTREGGKFRKTCFYREINFKTGKLDFI